MNLLIFNKSKAFGHNFVMKTLFFYIPYKNTLMDSLIRVVHANDLRTISLRRILPETEISLSKKNSLGESHLLKNAIYLNFSTTDKVIRGNWRPISITG